MKDLKQSTKQRFAALDFDYPEEDTETEIVVHESGVDATTAKKLVQIAQRSRNLKGHGLDEGMSTRLLIYSRCCSSRRASTRKTLVVWRSVRPLTDDPDMRDTLDAAVATYF